MQGGRDTYATNPSLDSERQVDVSVLNQVGDREHQPPVGLVDLTNGVRVTLRKSFDNGLVHPAIVARRVIGGSMFPCSTRLAIVNTTSKATTATADGPRAATAARRTGNESSSSPGWKRTPVETVNAASEWCTWWNRQSQRTR